MPSHLRHTSGAHSETPRQLGRYKGRLRNVTIGGNPSDSFISELELVLINLLGITDEEIG